MWHLLSQLDLSRWQGDSYLGEGYSHGIHPARALERMMGYERVLRWLSVGGDQREEVARRRGWGLRSFWVGGLVKVSSEAMWRAPAYNIQEWIRGSWKPRFA